MTVIDRAGTSHAVIGAWPAVLGIVAVLTVLRLVALRTGAFDLDFEEAQYWTWAREFSFGYFSKPPMIAWVIGLAESLCGSGEACIRSASPLLYAVTILFVFATARDLYGDRIALWSALFFAFAPGVAFSARLITTDVPLLAAWAAALFVFVRFVARPGLGLAFLLGIAIGLGLLSKYAMAYFYGSTLLAALFSPDVRRALLTPAAALALVVSLAVVAPNLFWNAANDFQTFAHTGENIRGAGLRINVGAALGFVAAQFGIILPFVLAAVVARLSGLGAHADRRRADVILLCFSVPIIAVVAATALVRGANANWAAPAFVAATILGTAMLARTGRGWPLVATLATGLLVQLLLLAGDHAAARLSIPGPRGPIEPYARVNGWPETVRRVEAAAERAGARTLVAEQRPTTAYLSYYARTGGRAVRFWGDPSAEHFFALEAPLARRDVFPAILMTECAEVTNLGKAFGEVRLLGREVVSTGPTTTRTFSLVLLDRPLSAMRRPWPCG